VGMHGAIYTSLDGTIFREVARTVAPAPAT
jgi:hypothetical protein